MEPALFDTERMAYMTKGHRLRSKNICTNQGMSRSHSVLFGLLFGVHETEIIIRLQQSCLVSGYHCSQTKNFDQPIRTAGLSHVTSHCLVVPMPTLHIVVLT